MAKRDEILDLLASAKPGEKIALSHGTYIVENGVVILVGPEPAELRVKLDDKSPMRPTRSKRPSPGRSRPGSPR